MNGKGVSEKDYQNTIEQLSSASFQEIIDQFFHGTKPFESIIVDAFEYLGLELNHSPSKKYSMGKLGFKSLPQGNNFIVKSIFPGSPAEMSGLMLEDEIISVNSFLCAGELDAWLEHFDDSLKTIHVMRKGKLVEITFTTAVRNFYSDYSVSKVKAPTQHQKRAFERWLR